MNLSKVKKGSVKAFIPGLVIIFLLCTVGHDTRAAQQPKKPPVKGSTQAKKSNPKTPPPKTSGTQKPPASQLRKNEPIITHSPNAFKVSKSTPETAIKPHNPKTGPKLSTPPSTKRKTSNANPFGIPYEPAGNPGERFTKSGGQCVGFVKNSRPDLKDLGAVGTAARMPEKARKAGFPVEDTPKVGSVLVLDKIKYKGELTGHVAIVEKVEPVPDKNGTYTLRIIDANSKADHNKGGNGSTISRRTVTFDSNKMQINDPAFKKPQHVGGFIGEKNPYKIEQEFQPQIGH